jgi:hypothetical protein
MSISFSYSVLITNSSEATQASAALATWLLVACIFFGHGQCIYQAFALRSQMR